MQNDTQRNGAGMNILVTGGAGFIGSNIVDAYLALGHSVVVIDDLSSGREKNVSKDALFYKMDIRDKNLQEIFTKHRIEFVCHQAARGDVRGSVERPMEYADVNVCGGINLLQCSVQSRVKGFIYSSTGGCVYGEPQFVPTTEEHPMQPRDPYGASKASFELYVDTYRQLYGLEYTIFRYPNVFGPRQNPFGEAGVVSIFTKKMLQHEQVIINGDGTQVRDYIFVKDVVRANMLATERNANTVFNLGSGRGTDVNTLFGELKKITGYPHEALHGPAKLGEVQRSILSAEKINKRWGWEQQFSLIEGLQQTIDFIKIHEV